MIVALGSYAWHGSAENSAAIKIVVFHFQSLLVLIMGGIQWQSMDFILAFSFSLFAFRVSLLAFLVSCFGFSFSRFVFGFSASVSNFARSSFHI